MSKDTKGTEQPVLTPSWKENTTAKVEPKVDPKVETPVEEKEKAEGKTTPTPAAEIPEAPAVVAAKSVVLVANQHQGGITFPRRGPGGIVVTPLRLAPGTVTAIDGEVWAKYRKMALIQHYLDAGLLAEVSKEGTVPVLTASTVDLPIPENLKAGEELVKGDTAKAGVKRETAGEVTI